ncbi:hypothetical protein FB45DRAFT_901042 [Roridomyces roridus]|uniref:SAM domain-containing protein n=1 Tax=Roridomyces roridus TaxID=1738132 RepID=A0AAD7C8L2_9AGAR|nr:hypothetical protein FB45DRAFT_901042 [Roridomyces roridus]
MAAAEVSSSPSQSSFVFPRPPSPTKPNAHPYPIKTTATGVLSRSNSVTASPSSRHHYVPTPPSPSPSAKEDGGHGAARRSEYRGHRYSRSLSSSEDMYLPSPSHEDGTTKEPQGPRALPIPPNVTNNSRASLNMQNPEPRISPKRWTPEQLAAHLGQAVSQEAGEWAVQRGVGGKAFMRMAEEDMIRMGAPASLRPIARALRQETLQAQLDSPISSSGSESGFPSYPPTRMSPTRRTMNASPTRIEEVDESGEHHPPGAGEDDDDTPSKYRTPHIRASAAPFSSSPSNPFNADAGGRFRNGRVRGMVRSFESSGSESGSEWDGSPERAVNGGSGFRRPRTISANSAGSASPFRSGSGFRVNGSQESLGSGSEFGAGSTVRPQRALPARPDGIEVGVVVDEPASLPAAGVNGQDELTVEELLAQDPSWQSAAGSSKTWRRRTWRKSRGKAAAPVDWAMDDDQQQPVVQQNTGGRPLPPRPVPRPLPRSTSGVHAWEAEDGVVGNTVKKVAAPISAAEVFAAAPLDSLTEEKGKSRSPSEEQEVQAQQAKEREQATAAAVARGRERGAAVRAAVVKAQREAEREGVVLRGMVEAFRVRLEEVERKVGEMEGRVEAAEAASTDKEEEDKKAAAPTTLTIAQRLNPCRLLEIFAIQQDRNRNRNRKGEDYGFVGPTTISGLPSYVLLVGLGVCAVVLRVLVRRGARRV